MASIKISLRQIMGRIALEEMAEIFGMSKQRAKTISYDELAKFCETRGKGENNSDGHRF